MDEPIEMRFRRLTRTGPRNHVLNGVEITIWEEAILGVVRRSGPLKNIGSLFCGVRSKWDHSILNNSLRLEHA